MNQKETKQIDTKAAFAKLFRLIEKHNDIYGLDLPAMKREAECQMFKIDLVEKYGFDPSINVTSIDYISLGDWIGIGRYGKKYNRRTISWPVDGRQPEDEYLLHISFPTGAYIFGEDYPEVLFQEFWEELKAVTPKYIDIVNSALYWPLDNASAAYANYKTVLQKYCEINKKDAKAREVLRLQKELAELQEELK